MNPSDIRTIYLKNKTWISESDLCKYLNGLRHTLKYPSNYIEIKYFEYEMESNNDEEECFIEKGEVVKYLEHEQTVCEKANELYNYFSR